MYCSVDNLSTAFLFSKRRVSESKTQPVEEKGCEVLVVLTTKALERSKGQPKGRLQGCTPLRKVCASTRARSLRPDRNHAYVVARRHPEADPLRRIAPPGGVSAREASP